MLNTIYILRNGNNKFNCFYVINLQHIQYNSHTKFNFSTLINSEIPPYGVFSLSLSILC